MPNKHARTHLDRARDELFSHVIRCDVLEAAVADRHRWLDETIEYMAHRYPDLTDLQLAQLEVLGRRFVAPAIPHGKDSTGMNRDEWQSPKASDA